MYQAVNKGDFKIVKSRIYFFDCELVWFKAIELSLYSSYTKLDINKLKKITRNGQKISNKNNKNNNKSVTAKNILF